MAVEPWLAILQAERLGRGHAWRELLRASGSADALLGRDGNELGAAGLEFAAIARLRNPDEDLLARWRAWLAGGQRALIGLTMPAYPERLRALPDAPLALWVEGARPELLGAPQLAMVGSRNPTEGGRRTAEEFARHFSRQGLTITSGLAVGIDGASHRGALDGPAGTVAVLGTGLARVYPSAHRALARQIAAHGILVSEYPPEEEARRLSFPKRNRIIAGLSLGTLIVEATRRSGALITARLASDYGREVFAIPGSIHNPLARGCHALIREGAKLVEDAADVLVELAPQLSCEGIASVADDARPQAHEDALNERADYVQVLDALGFDPLGFDALRRRAGLTTAELSSMLLLLELEGFVEALPGGRYARIAKRSR